MWDQESGSEGTVSHAVRRYTTQWGLPEMQPESSSAPVVPIQQRIMEAHHEAMKNGARELKSLYIGRVESEELAAHLRLQKIWTIPADALLAAEFPEGSLFCGLRVYRVN